MFATNWPVDGLYSSYAKVINAYKKLTKEFSKSERDNFFFKNAENIYDI
jgi:predicted TIM-barrel fold metal-dependent hydrolase